MEPGRTQTKVCKNTDSSSGLNTFLRPIKVNSDQKTNNLSLLSPCNGENGYIVSFN